MFRHVEIAAIFFEIPGRNCRNTGMSKHWCVETMGLPRCTHESKLFGFLIMDTEPVSLRRAQVLELVLVD